MGTNAQKPIHIYIYIYIYKMSLNLTGCNIIYVTRSGVQFYSNAAADIVIDRQYLVRQMNMSQSDLSAGQ
jgi:hypothetical protein